MVSGRVVAMVMEAVPSSCGPIGEIVANVVQVAGALGVVDFEVGNGGAECGVPVDDVCAAIDEPLLVQADERFLDGAAQAVVHGEVFARPVDGGAEAPHLGA